MASILRRFPVQVGLVGLIVYLISLSHGVTLASLPLTAKVAGWDWQPVTNQPLFWLLTLPLRLLPGGGVAPGLNLFSAACGALTLGILARSLELADWDRPLALLGTWPARLPILLAVAVCGLEYDFWRAATAATGEMLPCLLLAAAILCLLKFRGALNFRWLHAAAFIWGLGLVENWMMMLSLPVFITALFWLGREQLMKREVLLRLLAMGLAGFVIAFIILPLANGLAPHSPWTFGEAWLNAFKGYKNLLANLLGYFWRGYRMASLAVIICFMVPVLPAVIRLRDPGTLDKFFVVDQFQVWIYRCLRLALLLACLWLVFDPVVGPRQIVHKQTGLALPFLSLDYLLGLGVGFLAGNFLLAKFAKPKELTRPPNGIEIVFDRALVPGAITLLVVVSLGLLVRNAPAITLANRLPLARFGELARQSLPPGGGLVLSDDPQRLAVFQAAAAGQGKSHQWLALDLRLLPNPVYRRQLARERPGDWLTNVDQGPLNAAGMARLITGLAQSNSIFYLHPSLNSVTENFYAQPAGLVYGLHAYDRQTINPPPLPATLREQNKKFWENLTPQLDALQQACQDEKTARYPWLRAVYACFHFQPVPVPQCRLLAGWYATALDDWGVQLQHAGFLAAAKKCFDQALALNENNPAVLMNLQCNTNLAAGTRLDLAGVDMLGARSGSFHQMAGFIFSNGPVDDPSFCYLLGNACYQVGLPRQAIQQFERARALAPAVAAPRIALIRLYSRFGHSDQAGELIRQLRSEMPALARQDTNLSDADLSLLEANNWLAQTNLTNARSVLQTMLKNHHRDARIADIVMHAYFSFGDYSNALQVVNQQLAADSDNVALLFNQASLLMSLGQSSNALAVLDHALTISNCPPIRLARAQARTQAGQYDAAEADYLELKKTATNNLPIYAGLAEIASRRHDTNRVRE